MQTAYFQRFVITKLPVQALVYFAVAKKGETPIDGKTDANPEGLTAVTGKHANAFAARLAAGDLSCKVLVMPGLTFSATCNIIDIFDASWLMHVATFACTKPYIVFTH